MKSKVSAAVAVACALALSGETSAWASFYEFTTLVGLPSGDYGAGTNAPQGFIYNNGTYTSLPFYLNGYNQITGINNSGQIVGSTYLGIEPHGFVTKTGSTLPSTIPWASTAPQRQVSITSARSSAII